MAGSETLTSGEYIKHHLTNLTFGKFPDGHWGLANSAEEAKEMGFWAIHVDSMFWSLALAASGRSRLPHCSATSFSGQRRRPVPVSPVGCRTSSR